MTVQEEVRQRIERDVLLAKLRKKIDSGKADFNDTFLYSDRAGKMLGEIFAQRLPDIPIAEREALCVELLRDRYTDINALCDAVQRALDEANGLHLKPQRAPFEEARAHLIGHSTADQTVSVETQQRRGRSATATMTRSMHDDRMKAEAKFRSGAGLQCYITRKTDGKCCEWCSAIAGRYEYHSEPKDVYRRHDNCGCSVTFENGRKRQDVWSKREWETPEPGAGAGDPVVLTKEQVTELQGRHRLEVLSQKNLTIDDKSAILTIKADEFTPCLRDMKTGQLVQTEVARIPRRSLRKYKEADGWGVDWDKRPSDEYVLGVFVEGETEPQGLIAVKPGKGGLYMSFASTAPHNNPELTGGQKQYSGVGGHLFAAAVIESVHTGGYGCVYGFAANEELLHYYIKEFGAVHFPKQHPLQIIIEDEAAQRLIDIYDFKRR